MKNLIYLLIPFVFAACASGSKKTESLSSLTENQKAYLAFSEYRTASLSPSGQLVVVETMFDNATYLAVIDRKTKKVLGGIKPGENYRVQNFVWNGEDTIVVIANYTEGYLKGSRSHQVIFRMDSSGGNFKQLFPQERMGSGNTGKEQARYGVVDRDIVEGKYLFVRQDVYGRSGSRTYIKKLNIKNGALSPFGFVKLRNAQFSLDNDKNPRLAYKIHDDNKKIETDFYTYNLKTKQWNKNNFWKTRSRGIDVLGFNKNNKTFYFIGDNKRTIRALFKAQMSKAGKVSGIKEVFSSQRDDILMARWDRIEKELLYVDYGPGRPQRKFFSNGKRAQLLKALGGSFKGEMIYLGEKRGNDYLLRVRSSHRPITYYIFNEEKKTVDEFLSANEKVRQLPRFKSQAFTYKTRDKLEVDGFLYKPKNWSKNTPLIIHIHGGPFGIRDQWGYNGDVQFLISEGFSVMQVNYRGSGGRGEAFEEKGYDKLGTTMQNDIADAALWAQKKGIVKKGNTCLWGISYGAYSSVMATHMFPDLFKCGIGFGGVYDWRILLRDSDAGKSKWARKSWEERMTKDDAGRLKHSPVSLTKNLKRPVYIMHGQEDVRCPITQAYAMKEALDKYNKPYKYKEFPGIGHWFASDQEQKYEAFEEIIAFLNANLTR